MLGLHENTVRLHLRALHEEGQADQVPPRKGERGRPAPLWQANIRNPHSPYATLATILANQLSAVSDDPVSEAEAAGEAWGDALAENLEPTDRPADAIAELMRREGFAPEQTPQGLHLTRCPLIDAANHNPEIVCGVHRGMIRGALRKLGEETVQSTLIPFATPGACALLISNGRTS